MLPKITGISIAIIGESSAIMKSILQAAALVAVTAVIVLFVQHQIVSGKHIDDPTFDIWK